MKSGDGIDEWRSVLPSHVVQKSEELLARVEEMRINQVIYPPQDDVLNALASCAPSEVRAVILGQDPYHGPGQAMGLSFSVPAGEKLPPSLRNIYKEMVSDLGCGMPKSGDLTPWANQGVLLLNTTLTVREHEAASHAKLGWQALTSHVVKACFELPQPVVFLRKSHCALRMALWVTLRQASFACLTILKQVVTQGSAACLFMEATSSCSPRPIRRPFPHRVPRAACRHFWGRVRSQKLMPCFLGQGARRLIGRV